MSNKTFEVKVYIKQGNAKIAHTVHLQASSSFSAQQMANAQYGSGNVISVPVEVSGGSSYNSAPWMENF